MANNSASVLIDVHSMVKYFGNWFVVNMNMWNGDSNIVLDASIHDNECIRWSTWRFKGQMIKLLNSWLKILVIAIAK